MQDPPAGTDRSDDAAAPPVTSAAMPSTTAAAPATTAMPSVATTAVTTATAVTATTAAGMTAAPGKKPKNWKLSRGRRAKAAEDSTSQQDKPGTDHPEDHPEQGSADTREESREPVSGGVESTAVPSPPPPPGQEPAAPAGKMPLIEDESALVESVQAVANLLVAEGLAGPPSNILTPGRSAPTSSGGSTPQYFDLAGHKVTPTRREDRARDLFHGKVTPIMLQMETISAVDLPEGRWGEFVLDHAHLHLLDRIQAWCDEDVTDTHPEVTRTQQADGTWSFMADGVVQLILGALDLPPHTSMIQMGEEGAALSASVLPAEPPVTVAVTTAADGGVTVQAVLEEPWSDSHLSGGKREPEKEPETVLEQEKQASPEKEEQSEEQPEEQPEEPAKKTRKRKRGATKKKATTKTAKKARKLSSLEEGDGTPSPVVSASGAAMGGMVPETADQPGAKSPLLFHEEGSADAPVEMPELEMEQEAAKARARNQPAPEMQQEEASTQQDE